VLVPHAISVVRLVIMLMFVHRGVLLHLCRTSSRLRDLARDSLLPGLIRPALMLLLKELTLHLECFFINAIPTTILFDSGATHSFMSTRYANTNELPLRNMKIPMIVITPKGPVEANYMTHRLTLTIMGREFWATPIILEESSIDLILGMSWLRKAKVVIQCGRGIVELTSPKGERFEVEIAVTTTTRLAVFLVDGKFVGDNIRVVRAFSDVFPEKLPGMPPDKEVEFVIDLLPGTAPISKRPYRMSVEELKELNKQLTELQEAGYIRPSSSPWGASVLFV
jgi:predicted aspartyl protease